MIESLHVVHLVGCDGEILVLASGEEGLLVVEGVGLTVILVVLFRLKVLVERGGQQAPAAQVEEAVPLPSG